MDIVLRNLVFCDHGLSETLLFEVIIVTRAVLCLVMSDSLWPHGLSGFSVRGVLQARILKWVAIPYTRGSF